MAWITEDDYFTGLSLRKTSEIKLTATQQERLIDLIHGFAEHMRRYVARDQRSVDVVWKEVFKEVDIETMETFTTEAMFLVQEINNQQVG